MHDGNYASRKLISLNKINALFNDLKKCFPSIFNPRLSLAAKAWLLEPYKADMLLSSVSRMARRAVNRSPLDLEIMSIKVNTKKAEYRAQVEAEMDIHSSSGSREALLKKYQTGQALR